MKWIFWGLSLILFSSVVSAQSLNEKSSELFKMVNDYRKSKGLTAIPLNEKLQAVAEAHALDLEKYYNPEDKKCNLHSWSNHGKWSSCCYTDDHSKKECMWRKPKEISNYSGYGFEIAFYSSQTLNPEMALIGWKSSKGHHDVILNRDIWKTQKFKAMGVFISEHYAVIWFGTE